MAEKITEDQVRNSLVEVVELVKVLYEKCGCDSVEHLLEVCSLAIENPTQLRLIIHAIGSENRKK